MKIVGNQLSITFQIFHLSNPQSNTTPIALKNDTLNLGRSQASKEETQFESRTKVADKYTIPDRHALRH